MSDLQCPATVLLIARELLVTGLDATAMRARNLASVFVASSTSEPLPAAAGLAQEAGCKLEPLPNISTGDDLSEALDHLSDLHRGETIAVVADAQHIRSALGWNRAPTAPVAVAIDASGWAVIERG